MANLQEVRQRRLARAGTVSVTGLPVEGHDASKTDRAARFPIGACVCVQDSPDNPCPCNGPLFWLPSVL
jgi:hypothetical protein